MPLRFAIPCCYEDSLTTVDGHREKDLSSAAKHSGQLVTAILDVRSSTLRQELFDLLQTGSKQFSRLSLTRDMNASAITGRDQVKSTSLSEPLNVPLLTKCPAGTLCSFIGQESSKRATGGHALFQLSHFLQQTSNTHVIWYAKGFKRNRYCRCCVITRSRNGFRHGWCFTQLAKDVRAWRSSLLRINLSNSSLVLSQLQHGRVSRCHCEPNDEMLEHTCNTPVPVGGRPNKGPHVLHFREPTSGVAWPAPRHTTNACGRGRTCLIVHQELKEITGLTTNEAHHCWESTEEQTQMSKARNRTRLHHNSASEGLSLCNSRCQRA